MSTHSSPGFLGGAATWWALPLGLRRSKPAHSLRAGSQNPKPLVRGWRKERGERPVEGRGPGSAAPPSCPGPQGPAQGAVSAALGAHVAWGPDHNGRGALRPLQCSSLLAKRGGVPTALFPWLPVQPYLLQGPPPSSQPWARRETEGACANRCPEVGTGPRRGTGRCHPENPTCWRGPGVRKTETPYQDDRPGEEETGCCKETALKPRAGGGQGRDGGQWGGEGTAGQMASAQLAGDLVGSLCLCVPEA